MKRISLTSIAMAALMMFVGFAAIDAGETTIRKKQLNLPQIWQSITASQRLKCLQVAKIDACRQLAERVYGFQLESGTSVYNLTLQSAQTAAKLNTLLKGAAETGKPEFNEDGIVCIEYSVMLRDVLKIIEESERAQSEGKTVKITQSIKNEDRLISATGNGAIPGSKGMKMILAERAAELDAFREMAKRLVGIKINSNSSVKDMCLNDDRVQTSIIATLKGLKPVSITYYEDHSCEVEMRLKIREIAEIIETVIKISGKNESVTQERIINNNTQVNDKYFTVTGRGAPPEMIEKSAEGSATGILPDKLYRTENTIIKTIISSEQVIE